MSVRRRASASGESIANTSSTTGATTSGSVSIVTGASFESREVEHAVHDPEQPPPRIVDLERVVALFHVEATVQTVQERTTEAEDRVEGSSQLV